MGFDCRRLFIEREEPIGQQESRRRTWRVAGCSDEAGMSSEDMPAFADRGVQSSPPQPLVPVDSERCSGCGVEGTSSRRSENKSAAQPPANTDAAVKKQIVEASLKAFGVPIEKIIEASVEEIQALDGYIRNGAADNDKLIQESDARIKQYEEEIKNIRGVMQQSVNEQQNLIKVCKIRSLKFSRC